MKVSGTIPDELYEWMMRKIERREFYGRSHALEIALLKLKEEDEGSSGKKGEGA